MSTKWSGLSDGRYGPVTMNRSDSFRTIASRVSEMTLDFFSCSGNPPYEHTTSRASQMHLSTTDFEREEDMGFEIDESASLQTAYQLSRV